ncbi:MAG TPA: nuclear transport factor 2 family protein [Candidatus Eremiobacteraceae bacterium]|nr:nuclear transport factor 2 family protein [Candidatus Eremiobacteraceae bacterium]
MFTQTEAQEFAQQWIRAWNSHDLEAIMSHYASSVTLTSPVAAKLLNLPSGTVEGKPALRSYFARGLEAFPQLKFELADVLYGLSSIVVYYINHKGTKTAEYMEFDANKKVIRVVANYSA